MTNLERFIFKALVISLQSNDERTFDQIFETAMVNQEVARLLFQAILYNYERRRSAAYETVEV